MKYLSTHRRPATAGVLAALLALGTGEVVARLLTAGSSPVLAVGQEVIEDLATPRRPVGPLR
ncbi:MAG: hypothetical protein KY438_08405 [Actinobacteria bacterium]|nr:hypothetical protein [Actinomycetota bacterium]